MLLTQLVLDRFKSFKEKTVFDFSVSDKNKNIVLIGGDNGSGKTSLLEALNFVLYGVEPRNIIGYFNNSTARENNGGCSLELEYIDDEGDKIRIKRSRTVSGNYTKKEDIRESMVNTYFVAYRNGATWNIKEGEWLEEIDAKMPQNVSEFFFFEGEKIKDMASDNVPEMLRASMEKIIGLESINTLIYDLNATKRNILNKIIDVKNEDVEEKKDLINMKSAEVNKKQKEFKEVSDKLTEAEKRLAEVDSEYRRSFGAGTDVSKKIKEIDATISELNKEMGGIEETLNVFFNKGLPFLLLKPFFNDVQKIIKDNQEYYNYIDGHKRNQEIRNKIIDGLYKPKDVIRGNEWNEKNQEILENKISEILDEKIKDKPALNIDPVDQKSINNLISSLPDTNIMKEKQERKNEINRLLKNFEWERDNFNISDEKENKRKELISELNDLQYNVSTLKNKKTSLSDEIRRIKGEIAMHEKDYDRMRENAIKSDKDKIIIERIKSYLGALEDYKRELRTSKIGILESNIEKMFKCLYKKGNVGEIQIDPDSFNIQIFDLQGHRKYQRELSEGEKSLLAISLIWGLSKTSNLDLPIITDAPLSVLDEKHRNNVLENYFPNASSQVIILIKEIDLLPNSDGYNLIRDHIGKTYTLDFDKTKDITTLKYGYFNN